MTDDKRKKYIDPLVVSVGCFTFKSVAQAVIGWIGLEAMKKSWKTAKKWFSKKS